jgi:hypothetical protein
MASGSNWPHQPSPGSESPLKERKNRTTTAYISLTFHDIGIRFLISLLQIKCYQSEQNAKFNYIQHN